MNRDNLLLLGVLLIVLIVLGSTYTVMYRGVAPSLLGTYTQSQQPQQQQKETSQAVTQTAPFSFKDKFLSISQFSVNYDVYVMGNKEGELAIYYKNEKTRWDYSKENVQFTVIKSGDSYIYCVKSPGEEWSCFQTGSIEEAVQSSGEESFRDPLSEGKGMSSPSYNGSRTYAGQKGYCYYVRGSGGASGELESINEICITDKGVPLYYSYLEKAQGSGEIVTKVEIIAKTISYSVADTVFNPPATPS